MCTRVLWPDAGGSVVVGRNMDFHMDLLTNLWKMPRGVNRSDGADGELTWSAKYGSVVATAFDLIATDGMNEAGLAGHVLWLTESEYGSPDSSRVRLSQAVWLQYYLDMFGTVAEAVDWTERTQVQVVELFDPTGHLVPKLHLALSDASGDSVIIEYIDGVARVHHDAGYRVMTNSPPYEQQIAAWREFAEAGTPSALPGSTLASDRFIRASYYLEQQRTPESAATAMAAMFSIIRNAAQPFRAPEPGKPEASQTIWQVVADQTRLRYAFESTTRPNIVWVDFVELDLSSGSPVMKLDLVGRLALEGGLSGNVSYQFTEVDEAETRVVEAGTQALEFVAQKRDEFARLVAMVNQATRGVSRTPPR